MTLSRGGSMNEGMMSTRLGLTGIPNAAEDVVHRARPAARRADGRTPPHPARVHARRRGDDPRGEGARHPVTAEATPHHFTLTDEAVESYRTDAKVNPPLRTRGRPGRRDRRRADGTLDVIATDHAPHHYDEKEQAFEDAPFGLVGLETALGLAITELVERAVIDLPRSSCA
jgi:dihydroorotase